MTTALELDPTETPGVLTAKLPTDEIYVTADFSTLIPSDWTLNACDVTIAWFDGEPDASPNAMLDGTGAVSGFVASQRIIGGTVGADYLISFKSNASKSSATQRPVVQFILPVRDVRLG